MSGGELLTIGDAARLVGRSQWTLIDWERKGVLVPDRDSSGRRLYRVEEVRRVAGSRRRPGDVLREARARRGAGAATQDSTG